MNERQLKIFYTVAQTLNMTEATKILFITQPAISQTIKELEQEFGVQFFDRIGKKLYLTKDGETLFSYARRILNLYNECTKEISNAKNMITGSIRLGASTTIGIYMLPDIIGSYKKHNKNIDISLVIENTSLILDMILSNKIDFAYIEGPVRSDEIIVKEYCSDELVIVAPYNFEPKFKNIFDENFIIREKGSGTREIFENEILKHNIKINNVLELGNTEAIKRSVIAGLGISCLSKRTIQSEIQEKKLKIINLKDIKFSRNLNIVYHKDKNISPLFKSFLQYSKENI